MNAPIITLPSFVDDLDSSLLNISIPAMISNKKEDTRDPRWMEAAHGLDESIFESTEILGTAAPAVVKKSAAATKAATKKAKGPSTAKKYKKAPDAPRRFKSAFIFFSIDKHRLIRESLNSEGQKEKTTNVAKMVSEAWKGLGKEDREVWEEKARRDRARYEIEVANYKGPWKVPAKRAKKPQDAPKRPMSAFLSFSNKRRMEAMRQNSDLSQAEISALLSKMWNEAPKDIRNEYVQRELVQREKYKKDIAVWREKDKKQKAKERADREENALKMAESNEASALGRASSVAAAAAAGIDNSSHLDSSASLARRGGASAMHAQHRAELTHSSEDFALGRPQQQQQQQPMAYAQNVARIARQQETLQQLSNVYLRQQETLQNLIMANMAANLGRQQQAPSQHPLLSSANSNTLAGLQGVQHQMAGLDAHQNARSNLQHQLQQLGLAGMQDGAGGHQQLYGGGNANIQGDQQQGGADDGMDWADFPMGD